MGLARRGPPVARQRLLPALHGLLPGGAAETLDLAYLRFHLARRARLGGAQGSAARRPKSRSSHPTVQLEKLPPSVPSPSCRSAIACAPKRRSPEELSAGNLRPRWSITLAPLSHRRVFAMPASPAARVETPLSMIACSLASSGGGPPRVGPPPPLSPSSTRSPLRVRLPRHRRASPSSPRLESSSHPLLTRSRSGLALASLSRIQRRRRPLCEDQTTTTGKIIPRLWAEHSPFRLR